MTRLTYDILKNGRKVLTGVKSYQRAKAIVAEFGNGFSYKAVYTTFDPEDTPERREARTKRAKKLAELRSLN